MRRFSAPLTAVAIMLLGILLGSWSTPAVVAQEATPVAEEFMPEGIIFEPLAFATGLALPSTGELFMARVSFEPGTGFPIDEDDPTYALAVVESGELTVRLDAPLVVTRAGAFDAILGGEEADGEFVPETEEIAAGQEEPGETFAPATEKIAAGQEVTVQAGDAVLFPPNAAGEIRNDSQERTVVLVALVGPPVTEGTPTP